MLRSQLRTPRPSPDATVIQFVGVTEISIDYSSPGVKGRKIWGGLVPYGEVWRTGANEATEITITKAIKIAGNTLKAGTYTLFTIPHEDRWTIILNSELGQWGAYNYNEKFDVLRFDIPTTTIETVYEPFTIGFDQKARSADLVMMWDRTKVTIPIDFM
jgi:hypothetical protein